MTRQEAIAYLKPIADSASLENYRDAIYLAIEALRFQEEAEKNAQVTAERQEAMELRPCPFCGGEAVLFVHPEGGVTVYCRNCDARSKTRCDSAEFSRPTNAVKSVIDAWNRRVSDSFLRTKQEEKQ